MKNVIQLVGEVRAAVILDATRSASVQIVVSHDPEEAWRTMLRSETIMAFWSEESLDLGRLDRYHRSRPNGPRTEFVAVGTDPSVDRVIQMFQAGILNYIVRPVSKERVVSILERFSPYKKWAGSCLATRIDEFVEEQSQDPCLCMSSVAERFGITTGYVGRLYREEIGQTFRARLRSERVRRAKTLLSTSDDPMYLVADACGFRSASRFSETFSSEVGITPREFRYMQKTQS